jgi:hypothetical protein
LLASEFLGRTSSSAALRRSGADDRLPGRPAAHRPPSSGRPVVYQSCGLPERAVLRAAVLGAPVPMTCWRFHHWRVLVASQRVARRHQGQAGPDLPFANASLFVRAVWLVRGVRRAVGRTRVAGVLRVSWCWCAHVRDMSTRAPPADPCQRGKGFPDRRGDAQLRNQGGRAAGHAGRTRTNCQDHGTYRIGRSSRRAAHLTLLGIASGG